MLSFSLHKQWLSIRVFILCSDFIIINKLCYHIIIDILVAKIVSKKIAELGQDVYAGIFEENHPSRHLFGKLGFKLVGIVHNITTKIDCTEGDEWN